MGPSAQPPSHKDGPCRLLHALGAAGPARRGAGNEFVGALPRRLLERRGPAHWRVGRLPPAYPRGAINASFAANLLIGVLWLQQVWGYGVVRTGLAVAVGPLLVPVTAALVQRLLPRVSPSRLVSLGSIVCALGCVVAAARMGDSPAYLTAYLPAWAIGGIGVGFALPNLMAGSTHDLPPAMAATGSGVITMARQIGFVVGVSTLFALVGDNVGVAATDGLRQTWLVAAVALLVAGAAAAGMQGSAAGSHATWSTSRPETAGDAPQ